MTLGPCIVSAPDVAGFSTSVSRLNVGDIAEVRVSWITDVSFMFVVLPDDYDVDLCVSMFRGDKKCLFLGDREPSFGMVAGNVRVRIVCRV